MSPLPKAIRPSDRVARLPRSGMHRYFELAAGDDDVISLGVGEPDFKTPEFIREEAVASLRRGETGYTVLAGIPELREAIARHLRSLYSADYDPAREILVTVGSSEAMHAALLAVIDPGDEVLIPDPSYLSYVPLTLIAGGRPVPIPLRAENGFRLSAADVTAAITERSRAILLNYPNNPTGAILDRGQADELAAELERRGIVAISDEIYDQLTYRTEHVCLAALGNMRRRTLLLGGFSKSYAMTGWRLGYAAGPSALIAAMLETHQYTVMCAPVTAQRAALVALERGGAAVERMRSAYDRRRRLMVDGLRGMGLACTEPGGAFFAFPSVAETGLTDVEFAEELFAAQKVVVIPGSLFGAAGAGYVRCSYAIGRERLEEALERISRYVASRHRPAASPTGAWR